MDKSKTGGNNVICMGLTVSNLYIPPQYARSPYYTTLDTNITNCIQRITGTQCYILTGDVTLNTDIPCVPNTAHQQTSSPDITSVSSTF